MFNNISLNYLKPKKISLNYSKIKPKKDEVIIEIDSCGICGSDLKMYNNGSKRLKKNRVLGHEISGTIKQAPLHQSYFVKNSQIVLGADIDTNKDYAIGHEIDGGFQKYLKINEKLLMKLPHYIIKKKFPSDELAFTEPLACCLNGIEKSDLKPNKNILIFGSGSIGQLISLLCLYNKSKKIFLIDKEKYKLINGVQHEKIIKLDLNAYKKKIEKFKINNSIDYIFVACSSAKAQQEAIEIASNDTTINFFAGLPKNNLLDPKIQINTNKIHYKQLKIVGSHGSEKRHVIKAAKLLINRKIQVSNLITHRLPISKFDLAFEIMKNNKYVKIILKPFKK
jgi:L-iditol 2-dehydrogenase